LEIYLDKARLIFSKNNIINENKDLTFVQNITNSPTSVKGKSYVELILDSIFKRLYIFDGAKLKYFIGNGLSTNFIDTERFVPEYYGLKIGNRNQYSIVPDIVNQKGQPFSDPWQIVYSETKKRFEIRLQMPMNNDCLKLQGVINRQELIS